MMIGAYHSDPDAIPPEELRSAAAIGIPTDAPLPPGWKRCGSRAGTYARSTHIGLFDLPGDAWPRFMGEALPVSGRIVADGPAIEIYRSDMSTTPKEQLQTDLLVSVRE